MTYIPAELRRQVEQRAHQCCEYCLIHEDDGYLAHEVDHIIAEKHRGTTDADNLCLSCFDCNRYKGSDIGSIDIETDTYVGLFNPRTMEWHEHFELAGFMIKPLTPEGRVTEFLLRLNSEERVIKRKILLNVKRYPCEKPGKEN